MDIAERMLDRANAILERTRQRTAPHIERYHAAVTNADEARVDLRHHDLATQLDPAARQLPALERTVAALDTWQQWASGDTVTVAQLRDTVQVFTVATGTDHDEQHRVLGHAIQDWATAASIGLQIIDRRRPRLEHTGPELGL